MGFADTDCNPHVCSSLQAAAATDHFHRYSACARAVAPRVSSLKEHASMPWLYMVFPTWADLEHMSNSLLQSWEGLQKGLKITLELIMGEDGLADLVWTVLTWWLGKPVDREHRGTSTFALGSRKQMHYELFCIKD
jgi:hypothetical protein